MNIYKIVVKIVDNNTGTVQFVDLPSGLTLQTKDGLYKNKAFKPFLNGQLVEATVTVTDRNATVVSDVKPIATDKKGATQPLTTEDNWWGNIYINNTNARVLLAVNALAERLSAANALFVGPSGCGKTASAEALGIKTGKNVCRIDVSLNEDAISWFFERIIKRNTIRSIPTQFTEMVQMGNSVIILDELNRIQPHVANPLFPLLDHARRTQVLGKEIVVGDNTIFAATANQGWQYTGTFVSDAALTNRMNATVRVDYIKEPEIETEILTRRGINKDVAKVIVTILHELRRSASAVEVDFSTRSAINIGELTEVGLDLTEACMCGLVNAAPAETQKSLLDIINKHLWK